MLNQLKCKYIVGNVNTNIQWYISNSWHPPYAALLNIHLVFYLNSLLLCTYQIDCSIQGTFNAYFVSPVLKFHLVLVYCQTIQDCITVSQIHLGWVSTGMHFTSRDLHDAMLLVSVVELSFVQMFLWLRLSHVTKTRGDDVIMDRAVKDRSLVCKSREAGIRAVRSKWPSKAGFYSGGEIPPF